MDDVRPGQPRLRHLLPGRARIYLPDSYAEASSSLLRQLRRLPGVQEAGYNSRTAHLLVRFDLARLSAPQLLSFLQHVHDQAALESEPVPLPCRAAIDAHRHAPPAIRPAPSPQDLHPRALPSASEPSAQQPAAWSARAAMPNSSHRATVERSRMERAEQAPTSLRAYRRVASAHATTAPAPRQRDRSAHEALLAAAAGAGAQLLLRLALGSTGATLVLRMIAIVRAVLDGNATYPLGLRLAQALLGA